MSLPNPNPNYGNIQPPPVATPLDTADVNQFGLPLDMRSQPGIPGLNPQWAQFFEQLHLRAGALPAIQDTHANRANYNAQKFPGILYWETDRTVFYLSTLVSGAWAWVYVSGTMENTLANAPADIGTNDARFLFHVTTGTGGVNYNHLVQWTGTAWQVAPGERLGGYFQDYAKVPTDLGWQVCDGTATHYLDITAGALVETAFTTPNWKGVPAYRKTGAAYAGAPVAAVTPTISGSTASGTAVISNDTDAGGSSAAAAGNTYALKPHTHTDSGHTHGVGTLANSLAGGDPIANATVLPYFRQ